MTITDLGNGYYKLNSDKRLVDSRNYRSYSEVICSRENIRYFSEKDEEGDATE